MNKTSFDLLMFFARYLHQGLVQYLKTLLNLSEGNDRRTTKDRVRFFNIAYTSLKEVQSIMMLEEIKSLDSEIDQLSATIFVLIRNRS